MRPQVTTTSHATDGTVKVNGAELYYQVRGAGPTILLIHGTGLDSGCYDEVAEHLAGDFKVLAYDRRGYSRSPRPSGWEKTSVEEQADDAAWLLRATANAPAVVFGSSSGTLIALDLLLRHPDVVRGAVLHEPSVYTCLPQNFVQEQFAAVNPIIEQAMASGGPQAAHRAFHGLLAGEGGFESLVDTQRRARWLSLSEFMFKYEFPNMILGYRPDPAAIAAVRVPVRVMRAAEILPINFAAAEWLASQLKTELVIASGAHLAYCTQPEEFAEELRPVLKTVAG